MTYPHREPGRSPLPSVRPEGNKPWALSPNGRPLRTMAQTRRYEMSWMEMDGSEASSTRIAPAIPAFESAFSALARGALVSTPRGPVAIEDLAPGTQVSTREGPASVRWIGRILLPPANLRQDSGPDVFRLTADSLGAHRPMPDLVLCSGARIVRRVTPLANGTSEALVPVGDFADGVTVTQITPMSAVQAYHLMLDRHAIIEVNGLPVESYHPGREVSDALSGDLLRLFLSFFPFIDAIGGFGPPVLSRMGLEQIETLRVG